VVPSEASAIHPFEGRKTPAALRIQLLPQPFGDRGPEDCGGTGGRHHADMAEPRAQHGGALDLSCERLGEVDRIARRGRNFGFRLISITQRPAKLNKDVLTQLSTLIALGVTSPQDRDAIKAWVDGNADRDKARDVYDSLAHLKVGEGWLWAPDHSLLKRVKFPAITTLDTSKTPKAGDVRITAPVLAHTDIAKLRATFVRIQSGRSGPKAPAPKRTKSAVQPVPKRAPRQTTTATRPPSSDPVAAAIMRVRSAASLTQAQLAERLKTDQGNIARLERGRTQATIRTLKRIAEATGHSLIVDFQLLKKNSGNP
jgi:ribosome-binding protein aMBF1 (putative translation factor)